MTEIRTEYSELSALLLQGRMDKVLCVDSVDSTNRLLRTLAEKGAQHGQIVIADEQTAGRGRRGRKFESPKDKGIYLSALLRPQCCPAESVTLTAWTAVAVCSAIEKVYGVKAGIKWVNDIVLNRKKICGILTEMSVKSVGGQVDYIIIGIGVNVNEEEGDFPDEIGEIASSLYIQTGKKISRAYLAAEIIKELDALLAAWPVQKEEYLEKYHAVSITVGQAVRIVGDTHSSGTALAINDDFSLLVRFDDGTEKSLSSGEVSVRGLYGYV